MIPRSLVVPSLLVAVTLLVSSGACSQHDPGPYEGGGRTIPTSVIGGSGGSSSPPDSGASKDVFTLPDVGPETGSKDAGDASD